jgi:hypothetical protein
MYRNQSLRLKRRIRFVRKEKILYVDIMLDVEQMKQADVRAKKQIVIRRLIDEIPEVIRKYSIADFDRVRFNDDWNNWLKEISKI